MIQIFNYGQVDREKIFARVSPEMDVEAIVSQIIRDVRKGKDQAVIEYSRRFDRVDLRSLEVSRAEIEDAKSQVTPEFLGILERAAANIRAYHEMQVSTGFEMERDGIILGQKVTPIEKVGIYVPGGTAAYPSTVLMDTIPAKIAGCKQIVMVTPPGRDGKVNPAILAAADVAGVDRIFKVGGAQAIAALAYGTESIPQVDKIVGPGNAFVAEAKKQVFGRVAIDMIAGPSEILIVADTCSNPKHIAADMLSQAEHDKLACAVLVTDSEDLAKAVQAELELQIPKLPRAAIARHSIDVNGKIIVAEDLEVAIDIANQLAPEHLELMVDDPFAYLDKIENAGSAFMGRNCPEALGDYFAGPNHSLPTSGTARFSSALSVDDFIKKSQYTYYTKEALGQAAADSAYFARQEGLEAHARSILIRTEE